MDLVVRSPDELLAAVPHILGFKPEESIVLVPFGPGLPVVRVDLPTTAEDRERVWEALHDGIGRHAQAGSRVGIVCITQDRRNAELASQHLSNRLQTIGVSTHLRLWADGERWRELDTGAGGLQSQETAERIAAGRVLTGTAQPAASRSSLAASLVGDRDPVAQVLEGARTAAAASTPVAEREWAQDRLQLFHADGNRLSDVDGARLLVAMETISTRDALWADMSTENAASHVALWSDLTRRAPDEARAAPAAMLGFASWLRGDGARAWCALDQVPSDRPYTMAAIVASALQNGLHPREWERHEAQMREVASELDESFVPRPPGHAQRDVPRPTISRDRPTPGR